jgi:superfamily II DNA or RNA helicase
MLTTTENKLLKYQINHTKNLLSSLLTNGYAVDMSDTGTGKTFCSGAVAYELGLPTLVICPKAVIPSWKDTLQNFNVNPVGIKNYESLIRGNDNSEFTSIVKEDHPNKLDAYGEPVKVEKLRFNSKLPAGSLIIFDEVHKCKALDSQVSELLISAKQQGYKILNVSASAATNPKEMKAFGYSVDMHHFTDHNEFKRNFAKAHGCSWRKGRTGGMSFDPESPEAKEGMAAIHNFLYDIKKCASRMKIKEIGSAFPENQTIAACLDMGGNTSKINRVYNLMESELAALDEHTSNYSAHAFAIIMKARRHSELLKVPTLVEQTETHIRDGKSVVLLLNFNESIAAVKEKLQKKYKKEDIQISTIVGGQSVTERENNIRDFQDNRSRIMICNIKCGGVGVSLHDITGNAPRVSLINPSYSAIELCQALGRIHRSGGKSKSQQNIVYAAGTIEEKIYGRVRCRLDNLSMLNDKELAEGIPVHLLDLL